MEEIWISDAKDEVTDLFRTDDDVADFFEPEDRGFGEKEPDYLAIADAVVNRLLREGYLREPVRP